MRPDSPRLARLVDALRSGTAGALNAFWREVSERGTPLVEPMPNDERQVLLTFLWRANGPLDSVLLISELGRGYFWNDFATGRLARLSGTDLWYRTVRVGADARFLYCLSPDDPLTHPDGVRDWDARRATWRPDPLRPRRYVFQQDEAFPDNKGTVRSIAELPAAPAQPWVSPRPGIPAGVVRLHHVRSATLGNERRIWVYTPPGYAGDTAPCHLRLLFDGWDYTALIPTPTILDNLRTAGRIPPLVAVLVDTKAERGRDLNGHQPFLDFVGLELLPWIRRRYRLSADPAHAVVGGLSLGAVAAAATALQRPDVLGNVLCQSGAFWPSKEDDQEPEWLARHVASHDPLPLPFFLGAGRLETWQPRQDAPSLLVANRHLRTVLQAKGYEVRYQEFGGATPIFVGRRAWPMA